MNNKGQALIEFVLILPVFLMIIFIIVDFGVIFYEKNELEQKSEVVTELIESGTTIDEILQKFKKQDNNFNVTTKQDGKFLNIYISDTVDLITPGMDRVLEDPYPIEVERVIVYEQ